MRWPRLQAWIDDDRAVARPAPPPERGRPTRGRRAGASPASCTVAPAWRPPSTPSTLTPVAHRPRARPPGRQPRRPRRRRRPPAPGAPPPAPPARLRRQRARARPRRRRRGARATAPCPRQRDRAEAASYRTETGRLLATARSLDTGDTPVAALLALEAGRRRGVDRDEVAATLQQVLSAKPSFLGGFPTVGEYAFGLDGTTFVSRTAKGIEVYDLGDHTPARPGRPPRRPGHPRAAAGDRRRRPRRGDRR